MDLVTALATSQPPPLKTNKEPVAVSKPGEPGTYEWDGSSGTIYTQATTERITTWDDYLIDAGLDPEEVEVIEPVGVRGWDAVKKEWNEDREAYDSTVVRMHYYKLNVQRRRQGPSIAELLAILDATPRLPLAKYEGNGTFVVAVGDLQAGKVDGDGVEGSLARAVSCLHKAAARLADIRKIRPIRRIHVAFLADMLEGFCSQGGNNAWRTNLTLTEQIRIVRRVMLLAVEIFAPLTDDLTVVAVPGNHDQAVRFGGTGTTRYDDSHDVECLNAVMDACALAGDRYAHVKFYTPETDDLTLTIETSGTVISHIHGHQTRKGKHFEWWAGQSMGNSPVGQADILLAGHFHHFVFDTSGKRKFIQVPSLESESTWYKNHTGETGDPGILTFVTCDGEVTDLTVVRG